MGGSCPKLANSIVVSSIDETVNSTSITNITRHKQFKPSLLSTRNTPSLQDPAVVGLSCVRKSFEETGISEQATTILLKAWRQGTLKQHYTYLKE